MSTLKDVVGALDDVSLGDRFHVGPAIFALRPWSSSSDALILFEDRLSSVVHPGYDQVLDVEIAREVLQVWSAWRGGKIPSVDESVEAVLHYATHDAYQEVSDEPR